MANHTYSDFVHESIISTGAEDDSIRFDYYALKNSINTGAGDDTIYFYYADSNTIDAGSGSDLIIFDGEAADNRIVNLGVGDSIQIIAGSVSDGDVIYNYTYTDGSFIGDDFVVYMKYSDEDTLYEAVRVVGVGSNIKNIDGVFVYTTGNYFSIDGSEVTQISYGSVATEYNDTIYAENLSTSIDAGDGSDIISIMSGAGLIDGGSGADRIYLGSDVDVTIVGEGTVSQDGSLWTIGEDSIYGVGSNYSITSEDNNLFKIVEIPSEDTIGSPESIGSTESVLGLFIGSNEVEVDESGDYDAIISVDSANKSATLIINDSDKNYNLTFYNGGLVETWNATLSSGNDTIRIEDIKGGNFDGGDGKDSFYISSSLQGNITLTGGATNDNLESGNSFYAESNSVSSSSNQNKITITDVNFNASDVILIDAGVENLTSDFFGDSRFYNYSSAFDASTDRVYAGTIFDASDLVSSLGMSFSMLRIADKSSVTLDDENSIDEDLITNVIWANSNSATIDFSQSQTDEVLIFTNTNSRGDLVSLGGDFDDTIHAGASDTIDAGGGDDLIYLNRRNHVVFGSSEGNDTIYGWDSTDTLDISSIPDVSISSNGLYLESDNGTLLIEGSFTNSTNIRYNDGIMRVADSDGRVEYNKNVTYYAGSTLVIDSSSNNTIDLSSSTYQNISVIDASNASGRDTFRYTSEAGDVTISNGDSKDVVDLSSYSIDEISTQFTDNGLIISIDDSNLNIVGTNLTTFSLASGKYTADFANQTLS